MSIALVALALWPDAIEAHGKAVSIALACTTPAAARPLTKVCTAFLKYADGDPVVGAAFIVTGKREDPAPAAVGPIALSPLGSGVYSAALTFPSYGRWRLRFVVQSSGSGEAELVDELLPPVPGAAPEVRARLQIVLKFGWVDVRNLALRVTHLLASGAWFALVGALLVLSRFTPGEQRWRLLRTWAHFFPRAAAILLVLVAASGAANGLYNTPTRSPGIFAPATIARLPFGKAYLAVFGLKMALMLAILASTTALALALHRTYGGPEPMVAGGSPEPQRVDAIPDRGVTKLAALSLTLGALTLASVVVLGYLHMISHVGAAAGAP